MRGDSGYFFKTASCIHRAVNIIIIAFIKTSAHDMMLPSKNMGPLVFLYGATNIISNRKVVQLRHLGVLAAKGHKKSSRFACFNQHAVLIPFSSYLQAL